MFSNYFLFFLIIIILIYYLKQKSYIKKEIPLIAIAVFNDTDIKGSVLFSENNHDENIKIDIKIRGLKPDSLHGFHVHEAGDLSEGCTSACKHFNPFNKLHGCPGAVERHVGDLGNIKSDSNGEADYTITDDVIQLRGMRNIIGRCLIIHADPDDCGKGQNEESKKTGNAGKRIACTVIGYSKLNYQ
jgi:Cu-Zn family superoxide dismutase